MLKKAVKLLRGSVCVRAKSAYPERMLNLCSARGIEFWDVRWIDDTALSFCVARSDLRALRPLILRVRGQNLTLRSMTDSEVRIFGKIDAVEYVR